MHFRGVVLHHLCLANVWTEIVMRSSSLLGLKMAIGVSGLVSWLRGVTALTVELLLLWMTSDLLILLRVGISDLTKSV